MWPIERFLAGLRCTGHHRQGQTSHSRVSLLSFCCPSPLHGSEHSKVRPVVTQYLWELAPGLFKITRNFWMLKYLMLLRIVFAYGLNIFST